MFHRLCGPPSIPLSFSLATVVPRWGTYQVTYGTHPYGQTPSAHRLQLGLPGYLILFAPLAFVPQRQVWTREPTSPQAFLLISTNFTFTLAVLLSSSILKSDSLKGSSPVEPKDFTFHLSNRLRTLYTQSNRVTLATSVLPRLLARS